MRKTKEEHEITKKLLLEVAWYLFEKDGYYHTSLENIATSAWVTRWAIYWNFSWKIDLLEKLFEYNHNKFSVLLELDFEKTLWATQRLKNIFEIYFWLLQNDESFRQIERLQNFEKFIGEEKKISEKFSQNDFVVFSKYVEEIYKQGVLTLEFKNNFLPENFAKCFTTFFVWVIFRYLWDDNFSHNKEEILDWVDVLLKWVI